MMQVFYWLENRIFPKFQCRFNRDHIFLAQIHYPLPTLNDLNVTLLKEAIIQYFEYHQYKLLAELESRSGQLLLKQRFLKNKFGPDLSCMLILHLLLFN